MNYLPVIRPQAGQITQPQSCAFLHGVDWIWSILTGGLSRLTRGWSIKRSRIMLDTLACVKWAVLSPSYAPLVSFPRELRLGWPVRPSRGIVETPQFQKKFLAANTSSIAVGFVLDEKCRY
ncbi:hypothetical protein AVEN_16716-1 [Araneus ventricosus]|uniref:Uncharacterized protein n=1 Tax=Araneus ventricosus TaxID=182803 RepID=A0A4Y2JXF9_ARAVE|nr:hypothetical protein AVEN_16716-1 [Araneus ventricosus]